MTRENQEPQSQPEPLQFEQAEYAAPPAPAATCAACQQPIPDLYYTAGQAIVCTRCRDGLQAYQNSGSPLGRLARALGWGLAAAFLGSILWFAVRKLTGYEIGIVAIVVGLLVGSAVRKGTRGRGGLAYQFLAVLLTYCSIVSQYMPDIFQEMMRHYRDERVAAATQPATTRPALAATPTTAPATAQQNPADADSEPVSAAAAILAILLLLAIVFIIAFIAPVLAGAQNLIGLLIIAFALWEAWKLNKRQQIVFAGPFAVGSQPNTPTPAGT